MRCFYNTCNNTNNYKRGYWANPLLPNLDSFVYSCLYYLKLSCFADYASPVWLITGATLKNLAIFEGIHLKSISVSLKEIIAFSAKVVRVRNFVKFDQAKGSSVKRILRAVKSNFYISTSSFKKKNTHGNSYIGQGFSVREIRNYVSHAQSTNMENVNSSIKKNK